MLCKYYWIVLYTVHVTAFCLGGRFFRTRCISQFAGDERKQLFIIPEEMYRIAPTLRSITPHNPAVCPTL